MSNIPLKTITFPGLDDTYTIPQVDNTLLTAGAAADAKKTGDEITDLKEALTDVSTTLTHKADKDGTVASAEQLLSDVGTEDKQPYLFRATPYDSTRVDEEIVGATVGWNQLVQNGNFADASGWTVGTSVITVQNNTALYTGTANSEWGIPFRHPISSVENHKLLVTAKVWCDSNNHYRVRNPFISSELSVNANTWADFIAIGIAGSPTEISIQCDNIIDAQYKWKNVCMFDLTAWFGSTIADYAYTLETATAGSGVAWIKALLPSGYIPFSAPKMESVSGLSGHRFTGFNWFDKSKAVANERFNSSGTASSSGNSRSEYIRIAPNTAYYVKNVRGASVMAGVYWYDANKTYISNDTSLTSDPSSGVVTSPANAAYLGINFAPAYIDTVCVNISDPAKNGTYVPYKETTYALDSDLTLRGILKMDSDHRVYADGDVYGSDGTVERRYGVIVLNGTQSTLAYSLTSGGYVQYRTADIGADGKQNGGIVSDKYPTAYTGQATTENSVNLYYESYSRILFRDSRFGSTITDVTGWNQWLASNPVTLVYELATPTTETADPYASPQNCAVGGTEEYVYAEGGSGVIVGHNSKYLKNMRSELERVSVAVPDAPGQNGTYSLKATVTSSGVTYGWVAD